MLYKSISWSTSERQGDLVSFPGACRVPVQKSGGKSKMRGPKENSPCASGSSDVGT